MRIAVLSNVQGNIRALEAVLGAVDAYPRRVEAIVSAGDSVGLGAHPNEVLDTFRERKVQAVRGNYDDAIAFERIGSGVDFPDAASAKADEESVAWTRDRLTVQNLDYLRRLPRDLRLLRSPSGVQVKRDQEDERTREYRRSFFMRALFGGLVRPTVQVGQRVLVVHGSPRALNEYVRADTANSILRAIVRDSQTDVLITGHAGTSFERKLEGVTFIGVGSVSGTAASPGQAQFAMVNTGDAVETEFLSVEYEPDEASTAGNRVVPFPR